MWVCDCPAQLRSPQATHGGPAGLWLPARHKVALGQKAEKQQQGLQEGLIKQGHEFHTPPCETWQVFVLEPGQSLVELIAMALPTLTLVFAEALTRLQHDGCTHTLIL